ncbi:DNA polymerase subunit delta [Gregarina niphandrodes]|uniref:DNA polymerase subunit delta n=1 Tax=Gregarina niphandrodes TaxID=110365 RepID=A0A023B6G4_GRENI|nr:DNA polymerase subunit delta [Gregarina niphandrodes]EZG66542.1 DNA polymerase subunit delta [Gregarina niphandrodes]|eukprot:XP_011130612.1 DNA polymerase subunit delta [Gregarina niphandrodes]
MNLRPFIVERVKSAGKRVCDEIKDVNLNEECIIIGTLYKVMKLKPQILDEYMENVAKGESRLKFVDSSDSLVIEDGTGRLTLEGSVDVQKLVTGLVVGLRGSQSGNGVFRVTEVITPKLPRLKPTIFLGPAENLAPAAPFRGHAAQGRGGAQPPTESRCIAFIADLGIGCQTTAERRKALVNLLADSELSVGLLVLQGRSVRSLDMSSIGALDGFIAAVAPSMSVHVMPTDEFEVMPLQPFPKSYLPVAVNYANVFRVTSPHAFSVDMEVDTGMDTSKQQDGELDDGFRVLCLPDACVADVMCYSSVDDPLEAMQLAFAFRSCAPTAPDTLSCFPFSAHDPFVLAQDADIPHLVVGCQGPRCRTLASPQWDAATPQACLQENGTLLVALPAFNDTGCVLFVDLDARQAFHYQISQ